MRIVVTGGFGYLGSMITRRFAERGDDVTVLSLVPAPADLDLGPCAGDVRSVLADITDASALPAAFDSADVVVHAAALNAQQCAADPARAAQVNGIGTRTVADAAARAGVRRLVYLSTMHVYGVTSGAVSEQTVPYPVSAYGITKMLGEGFCYEALSQRRIETLIARPANGFGAPLSASADCWMLAVPDFCLQAWKTGRIVLNTAGTQQRVFMPLADTVTAIELLATVAPGPGRPAESVYNVGSGHSLSVRQLAALTARACAEVFGREVDVVVPEGTQALADDEPLDYGFGRIRDLGFEPSADLVPTIREVAEFVRAM